MATLWVHITSGQGPAECCWVVSQVTQSIMTALTNASLQGTALELTPGPEKQTLRSALLAIDGDEHTIHAFLDDWQGTIQWIGKSPFRPNHKRKNWFVGVEALHPPEEVDWHESELRTDTMRASGAGGQHVNKTESAVRITHIPTGLSAIAQEERSQRLNRKLALARLAQLFASQAQDAEEAAQQTRWSQHYQLERGNPTRVFQGPRFKAK